MASVGSIRGHRELRGSLARELFCFRVLTVSFQENYTTNYKFMLMELWPSLGKFKWQASILYIKASCFFFLFLNSSSSNSSNSLSTNSNSVQNKIVQIKESS